MASHTKDANDEVETQKALIEQIQADLVGKVIGGEGSGGITVSDENLHDTSTDKANIYLNGDKEVAYNGWDATDYIPVRADRSYLIYSTGDIDGKYCCKYDANKTRVGALPTPCNCLNKTVPLLMPGFDGYLRFSSVRKSIADLEVFEANALDLEVIS